MKILKALSIGLAAVALACLGIYGAGTNTNGLANFNGGITTNAIAPFSGTEVTLGSSNAKVDTSGKMTVVSCTGCGGGGIANTQGTFASLPATCATSDLYWMTDSAYVARCSATNTWSYFITGYGQVTPPPSTSWSWDNQASATIDSTNGYEYLSTPKSGATNSTWRYRTAPATPYTLTALFRVDRGGAPPGVSGTLLNSGVELVMRQSTTGKAVTFRVGATASVTSLASDKWTSTTSFSATYTDYNGGGGNLYDGVGSAHNLFWLRMADNGTNIIWSWSVDGQHWKTFDTQLRGNFLTVSGGVTGPDQIGFGSYTSGNANEIALISWTAQ